MLLRWKGSAMLPQHSIRMSPVLALFLLLVAASQRIDAFSSPANYRQRQQAAPASAPSAAFLCSSAPILDNMQDSQRTKLSLLRPWVMRLAVNKDDAVRIFCLWSSAFDLSRTVARQASAGRITLNCAVTSESMLSFQSLGSLVPACMVRNKGRRGSTCFRTEGAVCDR